jgi:hypothetical protein
MAKRQTMAESRKCARDISRSDAARGLRHQRMDLARKLIMRDPGKAERLFMHTQHIVDEKGRRRMHSTAISEKNCRLDSPTVIIQQRNVS